ncbi:MAG: dienelactone hydrolase family protein [Candidatus Binatia bacterium]
MTETSVRISADSITLDGVLSIPKDSHRIVAFAHGSGSSRLSPRNTSVARVLRGAGIATLLFDLLTEDEAEDRGNVFDMDLLAQRLRSATAWIRTYEPTKSLHIGYFGASTGAAAALIAAAADATIRAVVSRGGRPDLAASALPKVKAPTLLIVGGNDTQVLRLNQQAYERLTCEKQLAIVPGATHLFEEPGTLEEVTRLATDWFNRHLVGPAGKR